MCVCVLCGIEHSSSYGLQGIDSFNIMLIITNVNVVGFYFSFELIKYEQFINKIQKNIYFNYF